MKTQMQKSRGWVQSLPQIETAIVVKEAKRFKLPKNLTCYNTMLELKGYTLSLHQHLSAMFNKNKSVVTEFTIEEDYTDNLMIVKFTTNTYTNSHFVKNQIDQMYSALLAVHSIRRNEAKLENYNLYGKTHNQY